MLTADLRSGAQLIPCARSPGTRYSSEARAPSERGMRHSPEAQCLRLSLPRVRISALLDTIKAPERSLGFVGSPAQRERTVCVSKELFLIGLLGHCPAAQHVSH